jgi:hypothetical protein
MAPAVLNTKMRDKDFFNLSTDVSWKIKKELQVQM